MKPRRGILEQDEVLAKDRVKHGKLFLTLPAREIVARKKAVHKHFRHKTPPARRIK